MQKLPPRLELINVGKRYPAVVANDGIDLRVYPGEIHAVLGENGAGKSTLMKIIYGVVAADTGEMLWDNRQVTIDSPAQARALGIGMVFQHFSLFETLTVAENISLALDQPPPTAELARQITEVSVEYGLPVEPHRPVHTMSVGERQRVEIVRCLLQKPRLLIMDEPTSVLTPQAVQKLFETLRRLAAEGCSIVYISHKLDEIRQLCHTATVLRNGRLAGTVDPRRETRESLAKLMIGRELPRFHWEPRTAGETRLSVKQLQLPSSDPFGTALEDIELAVRSGEIVGIAGISGNGQQELLSALSGERTTAADSVFLCGTAAGKLNAAQRRRLGLRYVPEERLGRGAVPSLSLSLNTLLTGSEQGLTEKGLIRYPALRRFARRIIDRFKVKCGGEQAIASSLSGGNLQKFIVGRETLLSPTVMLVAQPTWGVDIGAAALIRQALLDLRDEGVAVLVVSEDLEELLTLSDRIAVLADGRLSPTVPTRETSIEQIGLWMSGAFGDQTAIPATEDPVEIFHA
ncbi:ABC transporter [Alkalilimnicola ehrlichii]|uniref:ABC transporter n=1 Tax=Alkalilimnicola ehrlichii TaxID=351052 RepID=A0A3E0WZK2_9GAMM|nr:ABC transporter ATP-binding protein [Alkalilimnicola ehrlichii]RFA28415.1 ABC transporter [Alkalilimnicola ehrlichii]RFA38517.1 ABC transporter [Alkalilimnicola ehrlichii]